MTPAVSAALLRELRRLVDICDRDATLPDGSNPDTLGAHAAIDAADRDDAPPFCYNRPSFLACAYPVGSLARCSICGALVPMAAGKGETTRMALHLPGVDS